MNKVGNTSIQITVQQAEKILLNVYGIEGKASVLPGELDFNFKIKVNHSPIYILKISRPNVVENELEFQQSLLQHISKKNIDLITPVVTKDSDENLISEITDDSGNKRKVRLLTWISGRLWSMVNPQLNDLRFSLGAKCGILTAVLQDFNHNNSFKKFDWDISQSLWTKKHLHLFEKEQQDIIQYFQNIFDAKQESYSKLRKSVVHNDANDNNIIVSNDLISPKVKGIIDFGDAIFTQIINDVAITCAYAIMNYNDPLEAAIPIVNGYHSSFSLFEDELAHLYAAIGMRLVISVTKSAINKIKEPTNSYLVISEKPAWELLKKWKNTSEDFAHFSFRKACDFNAHPNELRFINWAKSNDFSLTNLFPTVQKTKLFNLDLSVSSSWIGHQQEFNNLEYFQFKINELQNQHRDKIIAGGYLEPRPIYTSTTYDKIGNNGRESRSIHLGVDYWLPSGTPVHAIFDGEVITAINDSGDKEYGGLIILKHAAINFEFYTLYGHLSVESATKLKVGDSIQKGERIAYLGEYPENGNWAPHLHFQIILSMLDYKIDFPGVSYHNEIGVWKSICPNPNILLNICNQESKTFNSKKEIIKYREKHLGKSLSLQYKEPIKIVRGNKQYLIDQFGKKYLDTVNNVAHVGHEHYSVVKSGQKQMALLNTNTRYLNDQIIEFSKALLKTLPSELNVVHFVNSGSEANELAIRMAKTATGEKDIIASEHGYHGNSNTCVAISSYKFDGKGGNGAPEHTHIFPIPDAFRGIYRGPSSGNLYAKEVQKQVEIIQKEGRNVCAFIIEPIISCGGQIELPKGFLTKSYDIIRKAGGICISDEVQTGCGRMGKAFWGFQLHNVTPDIVTIGKPIGNGHPLAAVVCTQEIAHKFANGMEYFNTFGGNPVSCAIGLEVLKTVEREQLQKNALEVGDYLKSELKNVAKEFSIIGDIRGQGLFLGVEFVNSTLDPLPKQTDYIVNRMKTHGILTSSDGPSHNVIKIKPPLVFNIENAKEFLFYLRKILNEDFMKSYE